MGKKEKSRIDNSLRHPVTELINALVEVEVNSQDLERLINALHKFGAIPAEDQLCIDLAEELNLSYGFPEIVFFEYHKGRSPSREEWEADTQKTNRVLLSWLESIEIAMKKVAEAGRFISNPADHPDQIRGDLQRLLVSMRPPNEPIQASTNVLSRSFKLVQKHIGPPIDPSKFPNALRTLLVISAFHGLTKEFLEADNAIVCHRTRLQAIDISNLSFSPKPRRAAAEKRSWTQPDLDKAIAEYKAERAARFNELRDIIREKKTSPAARKKAIRAAQKIFGRNAIVKALGVKSQSMVSKSTVWVQEIAEPLQIPLKRDQLGKAEPKVQELSEADLHGDAATVNDVLVDEEKEETLQKIRKYAESDLPNAKKQAEGLYNDYTAGKLTDGQVRKTIKTLMSS